jgi:sugar fermentation stimulation protein A
MFYLVQIPSATSFALARDIDPTYASAYDRARRAGVEAIAYRCAVARDAIVLSGPVPIVD